jgi:hypothetical protein
LGPRHEVSAKNITFSSTFVNDFFVGEAIIINQDIPPTIDLEPAREIGLSDAQPERGNRPLGIGGRVPIESNADRRSVPSLVQHAEAVSNIDGAERSVERPIV